MSTRLRGPHVGRVRQNRRSIKSEKSCKSPLCPNGKFPQIAEKAWMVRKGSPVRVRQTALGGGALRGGFLVSRSGSGDHFEREEVKHGRCALRSELRSATGAAARGCSTRSRERAVGEADALGRLDWNEGRLQAPLVVPP